MAISEDSTIHTNLMSIALITRNSFIISRIIILSSRICTNPKSKKRVPCSKRTKKAICSYTKQSQALRNPSTLPMRMKKTAGNLRRSAREHIKFSQQSVDIFCPKQSLRSLSIPRFRIKIAASRRRNSLNSSRMYF